MAGRSSVRSGLKGRLSREEAGFVDGHGLGYGALEGRIALEAKVLNELFDASHSLVR
jgi:hypothetical protein